VENQGNINMPDTLRLLKSLADETRLRLTLVLHKNELSVNELVALLGVGQSRVSRHLKILAEAGLLHARRDGLRIFYSAAPAGPAREFMDAVLPFALAGDAARRDREMAARVMEERALKTRQFFNAIAEDWDELNREILGGFNLPWAVSDAVPPGCGIAVDLGCGTGEVLALLRGKCREVIGVDGSPRMLEMARRRFGEDGRNVSLRIGQIDHLPLRDAEADFACINLVLHHLARPGDAFPEIARVLKPGGLALIADFDRHQTESMRVVYGDCWLGFSLADLTGAMAGSGLEVTRIRRQEVEKGLALHLLLARKPDA
jgi:ArsR family transcriptional regulator